MSEERLEEIKERLVLLNNAVDLDNETKDYIFNDLKIEWLVEQNKRYREAINNIKNKIPVEYEQEIELSAALLGIADEIEKLEEESE